MVEPVAPSAGLDAKEAAVGPEMDGGDMAGGVDWDSSSDSGGSGGGSGSIG